MSRFLYAMPGNEIFAELLGKQAGIELRSLDLHPFPDGETLVRVQPPAVGSEAIIVCTLDRPNAKILPLLMAASTLRELGAAQLGLVVPYLAYMRQDTRFNPGEANSSRVFGRLLDAAFDWLVTVDPHLHRHAALADAGMPHGVVVHAASAMAAWIRANVWRPLIIGPDGESSQWARDVAARVDAPVLVASKQRRGDRDVQVSLPDLHEWAGHTPVLLDDIIASGHTMIDTVKQLRSAGLRPAVCVGVHGVLADGALEALRNAGVAQIVTSNSIPGETAVIDLSGLVNEALATLHAATAAEISQQSVR